SLRFFFSSRRRHTRLQGDWSSDVCSSDLLAAGCVAIERKRPISRVGEAGGVAIERIKTVGRVVGAGCKAKQSLKTFRSVLVAARSEERRVGKEGRLGGRVER